ncbi:L,D-transpeptidase family protein [Flavisolibacter tropicus]|uniref:L,D-transpeptidase family protein n=1 Tax=Flavisolibacter tropicus TaxID=1492898 RepID=UPI00082A4128|nr:L,D-transpeptidase family protein [Flavisolibacter tropicus]
MVTTIRISRILIALTALLIALNAFAGTNTINPTRGYDLLQQALTKYEQIAANGGWTKITGTKKYYQQAESAAAVTDIKNRLRATGDYTSDDLSALFTPELTAAVKRVQKRFGFKENGVVDAALIKELNIPVEQRINQILLNMERLQALPPSTGGTRLVANIPEFKLHVYEGDKQVFDMNIVVGTAANKTVTFNDEMKQIVFSPYWNVPSSIVKNEILPKMRANYDYLWRNNYEQVGTENGLPKIRQLPGPDNALGKVKFVFPNDHNIYFHDTPAKSLFNMRRRAYSHGCIRLAEPEKLAQYLLRDTPGWTPERIDIAMNSGSEQTVNLSVPVEVAITYFTAWVDNEGAVNFREDIYGHDKVSARRVASAT